MTKMMLLAASVLILLSGALIAAGEEEAVDPVCGMTVSSENAAATAMFNGESFYFCSAGCYEKFAANPQTYLAGMDMGMDVHEHDHAGHADHDDQSTLEGSMENLQVLMLQAVEGVLHGEPDKVKKASAELAAASEMLKEFSKEYAGVKAPAFDAYAIELGKTSKALGASVAGGTEQTFNSLSTALSSCVSCHMNFRDIRSRSGEGHHH